MSTAQVEYRKLRKRLDAVEARIADDSYVVASKFSPQMKSVALYRLGKLKIEREDLQRQLEQEARTMESAKDDLLALGAELDTLAKAFNTKIVRFERAVDDFCNTSGGKGPSWFVRSALLRRLVSKQLLNGSWAQPQRPLPTDLRNNLSFESTARHWQSMLDKRKEASP
jgi:hypothetical protein